MTHLSPYITFSGNCREAMNFYKDCIGGDLQMMVVGDMPEMASQMPPEMKDAIMHAQLTSGNIILMASDLNMQAPVEGNTSSLCLHGNDEAEMRGYFEKLSAGGTVRQPMEPMPWGDLYGDVMDKFGKVWQFNCAPKK